MRKILQNNSNKTRNVRQSPACSPPGACKTQELLDQVHQIIIRRREFIGSINAYIYIAILPSVVESQRTEWRYANFRWFASKIGYHSNVRWAIAKRMSDSWMMHTNICIYP